jgi:serpin B
MRKVMIGVLAASALSAACAATEGTAEYPETPGAPVDEVVTGNTRFALELYQLIKGDANLFFSPYSISAALAMTYSGARGETAGEMAEVLHFPVAAPGEAADEAMLRMRVAAAFGDLDEGLAADPENRGYSLHTANALWGQRGHPFLDSYIGFVDEHFGAPLSLVDFAGDTEGARLKINAWVEERTRERIRDLIPQGTLVPATLLVLTDAIYFKGDWGEKFDPERTREADFRGLGGTKSVQMMSRKGDYRYFEDEEAQALELPYRGDGLSMVVLLPKVEGPAGLEALERALTPTRLEGWIAGLRKREVAVAIPRFEMTWGTEDITSALEALGMERAFDPGRADFSGMSPDPALFIGYVLHKAFIEVNEEGTEAAAATAVGMLKAVMPTVFRADRPFVFMIRDGSTGSILFLGRVTDLGE